MGSYGIGVSRAVAAIAETTVDDIGLCWPRQVAPADVHLVIAGKDDHGGRRGPSGSRRSSRTPGSRSCSTTALKVEPGVKFKDAELIGVPTIVVVGKRLADGIVEVAVTHVVARCA
jgi:prolyl-tRNA synthetase